MNRNKVLELAREAELARQFAMEVPFVVDRLERFAALVEREVRGGMSRDKVFELMLTAGCSKYCDPKHPELEGFIVNDSVLDRIVALIEREVRGDATPVGYTNEGYKGMQYANAEAYKEIHPDFIQRNKLTAPLFAHPTPAASAESVASVHIKDGCLIGSQRKSGVDIPDGQYALYPIGTFPAPAVDAKPVARLRFYKGEVVVTKDYETVERNGEFDVYTHPTPAVVRQLVDGLAGLIDFIEIDNLKIDQDALRIARAALAAAKKE